MFLCISTHMVWIGVYSAVEKVFLFVYISHETVSEIKTN